MSSNKEPKETVFTKENLDRIWNALEYTRATVASNFQSREENWVEIHRGRAYQSEVYLTAAIKIINQMRKELK